MKHATLFSGIGAPELAAYWLGWENVFHCEINPFCRQVIEYWFNNSVSYEDITKTSFKRWEGKIDVLSGGFPCQPFSVAGRRKGTEDDRYLWPEFIRVIREVNPRWVIGENVGGITSMVQPGKEIDLEDKETSRQKGDKEILLEQQFVIDTICGDLEREGYSVQPIIIPACAVGAPHRRDRVWFIAHHNSFRFQNERAKQQSARNRGICKEDVSTYSAGSRQFNWSCDWEGGQVYLDSNGKIQENQPEWSERECRTCEDVSFTKYPDSVGLEGRNHPDTGDISICGTSERDSCNVWNWKDFPTQSPLCGRDDGFSNLLDIDAVFKGISRTRGTVFNRWRTEAIKAYGNAMVPQVVYQIYKHIDYIENRWIR